MKWNRFQEAVFEDFRSGKGSTAVAACAGSGKSTTAVECLNHIPTGEKGDVLLTSFSTQSIDDLKRKEPPWFVEVATMNRVGNQTLKRAVGLQQVNKLRAFTKIDEVLGKNTISDPSAKAQFTGFRFKVKALVDLSKAALAGTVPQIQQLADDHDIDTATPEWITKELKERFGCAPEDAVTEVTRRVLEACKKIDGFVDFNDQLWLPVVLGMSPPKYERLLVDEAQDTSPVQIELLCRAMTPSSRAFMWGQNEQAIYAWRGAGLGMEPFIKRVKAKTLPLSISYRCPKAVVEIAQKLVPWMQAAPDAAEGLVESMPRDMLSRSLRIGDVVLSRKNAPLIGLFMQFLKAGVPAGIQGKDLGARLLRFVEDSESKTADDLLSYTRDWAEREIARRVAKNPNAKTDAVDDHVACIETVCEDTNSIEVVTRRVKDLLMADPAGKVILSSVHKAKGLEWPRVFLLESSFPVVPDYWLGYARKGDANEWAEKRAAEIMKADTEERNIRYVALTRSSSELYLVKD